MLSTTDLNSLLMSHYWLHFAKMLDVKLWSDFELLFSLFIHNESNSEAVEVTHSNVFTLFVQNADQL